jgi:ATP-dependent RNA helicase RhlE
MLFQDLGVINQLLSSLKSSNYQNATPIQEQAIPFIFAKKDILGIAKTGSGKTLAYTIPALQNSLVAKKTIENRAVRSLILVPTRELAVQVGDVISQLSTPLDKRIKSMSVFGGVSINPQMQKLNGIEILVATPGRLLELVENNAVKLSSIEMLILDEADKMLNLGFKKEMDAIFRLLPSKRQNLLFSATLSEQIEALKTIHLDKPEIIKVSEEDNDVSLITQLAYTVSPEQKGPFLRKLIIDKEMKQVLVFVSSTYNTKHVTAKLMQNGIDAVAISSKKTQGARNKALKNFKEGKLRVLVSTDLLGRGIDIDFLPFVINYELPRSPKDYIHRIGRTGRAENPGTAISLISPKEEHHFKVIQKKMKTKVDLLPAEF